MYAMTISNDIAPRIIEHLNMLVDHSEIRTFQQRSAITKIGTVTILEFQSINDIRVVQHQWMRALTRK